MTDIADTDQLVDYLFHEVKELTPRLADFAQQSLKEIVCAFDFKKKFADDNSSFNQIAELTNSSIETEDYQVGSIVGEMAGLFQTPEGTITKLGHSFDEKVEEASDSVFVRAPPSPPIMSLKRFLPSLSSITVPMLAEIFPRKTLVSIPIRGACLITAEAASDRTSS